MIDSKENIKKAIELKNDEKFEESLEILEEIFKKDPNSEEVKKNLIDVLLTHGGYLNDEMVLEYDKAIMCFNRIIEIEPNNFKAFYNLGIAYFNIGEIEKAMNAYRESLKIKPDYKYCLYNIGLVYELTMGELGTALEHYEKALEIDPKFVYASQARNILRNKMDLMKKNQHDLEQEKKIQKVCMNCGTLNRSTAKFCDNCGREV